MDPYRLPSKLEIVTHMTYFILVNEFLFFYGHWLFHASPYLYKKIHKVHHEYPAPNAFASLYCHPVELLLSDFLPLGAICRTLDHSEAIVFSAEASYLSPPTRQGIP
mmetsp:Transcript_20291/g.16975  ORF Transcript_20291/g.16975 Transcript_20291/m.16975 type:complete len:107 (-) Transcript_20291:25-345(-)